MALPPQKPGAVRSSAFDPPEPESQSLGDAARYNEELTRSVSGVEEAVEQLRVRYEQWFMGLERREPQRERDELKREVQRLRTAFTRNTGLRFRIQSLHARFISYERMWVRSAREKEEGTYRRDLLKARRLAQKAAADARAQPAGSTTPAAGASGPAEASAPAEAARSRRSAAPPALPAVAGYTEAQLRALHSEYIDAKRRCNEDVSRLTVDALARSLAKQVPGILSKIQAKGVVFRVAIQDGKTVLKAVPRS